MESTALSTAKIARARTELRATHTIGAVEPLSKVYSRELAPKFSVHLSQTRQPRTTAVSPPNIGLQQTKTSLRSAFAAEAVVR